MAEKKFTNYAPMLSMVEKYSDEKLDGIIKDYEAEEKVAYNEVKSKSSRHEFFKRNVDGLNYIRAERKRIKIAKEFVFKPEHIKLLGTMWHKWNNEGNVLCSMLQNDNTEIIKALDIKAFDRNGDYLKEDSERIDKLITELPHAIEHLIESELAKIMNK